MTTIIGKHNVSVNKRLDEQYKMIEYLALQIDNQNMIMDTLIRTIEVLVEEQGLDRNKIVDKVKKSKGVLQ